MQPPCNIFVGLDVSKSELVSAFVGDHKWEKSKISNTIEDITQWLSELGVANKHFVLEATGPYSERLIFVLTQMNATFSVVNPAQSRGMSKALLKTNKTDDQDAQTLSYLGQKLELKAYKMPNNTQKSRKEAFSALSSLQKQEQQLKNQIHAFEYRVDPNPVAVKLLQEVLAKVQEAIQTLEKEIKPEQEEEEAQSLIGRIASIKSVGIKTAAVMVTLFGDFQHFSDAKAFAKFIGLSPSEYSSGTTVRGRRSITKRGNAKARAALFNCARNAIRFNPQCKSFYQRLIEKGKNGKVALTAVMHKIARLIFGVVRSGTNYQPEFALLKTKNS